ncbi:MAG: hypothetical protein ACI37Z_08955 [Candidatus Gastranaerophilaceae bacterium]
MAFKNFQQYVETLCKTNGLEISFTSMFAGDNYLNSIWYARNASIATLRKEYEGHTFLFHVVSVGDKEVSVKPNSKTQAIQIKEDKLAILRTKYKLDDNFFTDPNTSVESNTNGVKYSKNDFSIEFSPLNHFSIWVYIDAYVSHQKIITNCRSLEELFVPFSDFYLKINKFIFDYLKKLSHFSFTPTCITNISDSNSLIPNAELYATRNRDFFININAKFSEKNIICEFSEHFLGFKYLSAFWYPAETLLAKLTYVKNDTSYSMCLRKRDISETWYCVLNNKKKIIDATAVEDLDNTENYESIEDLRLFYNFNDIDLLEFSCSVDDKNCCYYLEIGNFYIDYYKENVFQKREILFANNILEALYNLYMQEFNTN